MDRAIETKEKVRKNKRQNKKAKMEEEPENLRSIASTVLSILENITTMPTEASEIDEFWTVNPSQYEAKSEKKAKTEDEELLGDDGLMSDSGGEEEEENQTNKSKKKKHPLLLLAIHRRGFSDCWLSLLKLPLSEESHRKILLILHKRILPHMTEPKLLMDFLTDSYNIGGGVSLLALNGLFTLITEHNL